MGRIGDVIVGLMSGGTWELVLLIILVIVGLILLLVALWLLWKLLMLAGKGLLWVFNRGSETARTRSAARKEAALAAPPLVATGWGGTSRLGLRVALSEAARLAGPDALRIVIVAGGGNANLCRSLGLTPPGVGTIGIAAGGNTVLIDASQANGRQLRRLARALPWRRPVDGVAALVEGDTIPSEAVARAANFSRAIGMRTALHFVVPSASRSPAWRIIDAANADGDAVCTQLAGDSVRIWLVGGDREGLKELAVAQSRELPAALGRALAVAPSSVVDVASLGFSGLGLRGAVAQTVARTKPATAPGLQNGLAFGALAVGILLTFLACFAAIDRADRVRATVDTAAREAQVPWTATDVDSIPSGARLRRVAGLGSRLSNLSDFSALMPLAPLAPHFFAPRELGGVFLDGYMLRPLAAALEWQSRERLTPQNDPRSWIENARVVGEWAVAWEGLADDPREVDVRALLAAGFGGNKEAWPERLDIALITTGTEPPPPSAGGLDVAGLYDLARENFILTMQNWADTVYTNGPVATAARRAGDSSADWREQHVALSNLRAALQDPSQQWLTAAEDRSDHQFEMRFLSRALGLTLVGSVPTVEAKASVARIRIDARDQAVYYIMPDIGPLLTRASQGSGPSLTMTPAAAAWLGFLDKIANAGFADLPEGEAPLTVGLVTINAEAVSDARARLRVFEQFAQNLPPELPPALARRLVSELTSELVIGVTTDMEYALRPASDLGIALQRAERRAKAASSLEDLAEIEDWLRDRQAVSEAERVLAVRARVAEGVLEAAAGVLVEEDPLGVHLDPTADSNALVRRFERGVTRLTRIHEQLAAPYLADGAEGTSWAALHWRDMAADIDGYSRGDTDSTITGLEGVVRAYVEDPEAACEAPRPLLGRGDYLARTSTRFRAELDRACTELSLAEARAIYGKVKTYFERHVAHLWPYSRNAEASEISPSTLAEFVRLLETGVDAYPLIDEPLAAGFARSAAFWTATEDGATVTFDMRWRARPGEEHLAEHVAEVRVEGAERDEAGVYTWRYGAPFTVDMRLARNSLYQFVQGDERQTDSLPLRGQGNGALLRVLDGLTNGAFAVEAEVADKTGVRDELRLTARVLHQDGEPITMPKFSETDI